MVSLEPLEGISLHCLCEEPAMRPQLITAINTCCSVAVCMYNTCLACNPMGSVTDSLQNLDCTEGLSDMSTVKASPTYLFLVALPINLSQVASV